MVSGHNVYRSLPTVPISLQRITHKVVGGVTNFQTLFGFRNIDVNPALTTLRRKLGSVLDYSIRPARVASSFPSQAHFTQSSILPVSKLSANIFFHTSFSATGLGVRSLASHELTIVFGLPSHFSSESLSLSAFNSITPLQILDSLLLPALSSVSSSSSPEVFAPFRLAPPITLSHLTFFPEYNAVLPPHWGDVTDDIGKAARADDAAIYLSMWNQLILPFYPACTSSHLDWLCDILLRKVKYRLRADFFAYLASTYPRLFPTFRVSGLEGVTHVVTRQGGSLDAQFSRFQKDLAAGRMVFHTFMNTSFFNWDLGSTLTFWRWSREWQLSARDGFEPHILSDGLLPHNMKRASRPKAIIYNKMLSKFVRFIQRRYILPAVDSEFKSFIAYFGVPKGDDDVCVVYNGTSCGLNDATFASNFWLPNATSMLRILGYNYHSVDINLGDMFHNFPLYQVFKHILA